MYLIDSHCHLPPLKKIQKLDDIISRAKKAKVKKLINIAIDIKSSQNAVLCAQKYKNTFPSAGIYPNKDKDKNIGNLLKILEKIIKTNKQIIAIGECGIDISNWKNKRPVEQQKKLFLAQVKLALKYHLPLIIHNRRANKEIFQIISAFKNQINGVFHCFTGSKKFLSQIVNSGLYLGITGLVTYDQGLQEVVKEIPLNRLLLETDSPYLIPKVGNDKIQTNQLNKNEPANLPIIAKKIAEIKNLSLTKLAQITSNNCNNLFNLKNL